MLEVMKIAVKNALKNRKRTFFVCIAVLFSLIILLISSALTNGMIKQITHNYLQVQSGHIVVMWKDHYETSAVLPGKFLNPNISKSFNYEENEKNKEATAVLDKFLEENKDKIDFSTKIIRRSVSYSIGDDSYATILYGVTKEDSKNLEDTGTLVLEKGNWPVNLGEIMISRDRADKGSLDIGGTITIDSHDILNEAVTKEFKIVGIYENGAEYNNYFGIITPESGRDLFNMESDMYDLCKIFLKDIDDSEVLANKLDEALLSKSDVLRAENWYDAGLFFTTLAPMCKLIYQYFVVILLLIISIGLRSIIRLNIYSSMKEFGIMRAIGFSKVKCFAIVFMELFFVCCTAAVLALGTVIMVLEVIAKNGIYIGPSVMTNAFGGEYLYLILKPTDYLFAVSIIIAFSLFCSFGPAYNMCKQKVVNLLRRVIE